MLAALAMTTPDVNSYFLLVYGFNGDFLVEIAQARVV
jgi:hypothetical protein